ncbi:hypothetical protein Tco_1114515 [Tanacetum coccineum]|uniref:Uncharacterized protein n=1 Tax=Tanacetum coccineum TaxID=301880 RepID=A0ABQ5IVC4_9ASTR
MIWMTYAMNWNVNNESVSSIMGRVRWAERSKWPAKNKDGDNWGVTSCAASEKGKIACSSTDCVCDFFVANSAIQPHGWCSGLVDSGVGTSIGDHYLGNGFLGLVLDFQNSKACFLSAKQATGVSFLGFVFGRYRAMLDFENSVLLYTFVDVYVALLTGQSGQQRVNKDGDNWGVTSCAASEKGKIACSSTDSACDFFVADSSIQPHGWCSGLVDSGVGSDFGRYRVMLDFENSVLHLPSAEEDLRKLSGSVETQGESSSMNFRRKSGFTEYGSSSQWYGRLHGPSHGKKTGNTRSRGVRVEVCQKNFKPVCVTLVAHKPVPVTPISTEPYLQPIGPANPASTKLTKSQERKTPETSTEAINKPLKRTLFPDESMEHKKQKNPNGKVVHFTSTVQFIPGNGPGGAKCTPIGRKIPESPWGSPISVGYGDGDVKRFPNGDGGGDGVEKRGCGMVNTIPEIPCPVAIPKVHKLKDLIKSNSSEDLPSAG